MMIYDYVTNAPTMEARRFDATVDFKMLDHEKQIKRTTTLLYSSRKILADAFPTFEKAIMDSIFSGQA